MYYVFNTQSTNDLKYLIRNSFEYIVKCIEKTHYENFTSMHVYVSHMCDYILLLPSSTKELNHLFRELVEPQGIYYSLKHSFLKKKITTVNSF